MKKDLDLTNNRRIIPRFQHILIRSQEIGDEKLQIVQQIQDLIENKTRNLDVDFRNLGNYIIINFYIDFLLVCYSILICKFILQTRS